MKAHNYQKIQGTIHTMLKKNLVNKKGIKISEKSLEDVIKAPTGLQDLWEKYLYNFDNIQRSRNGKYTLTDIEGNVTTPSQSEQIVKEIEKHYPEFQIQKESFREYWDKFIHNWAEDDLISKDLYTKFKKMNSDYVPIMRELVGDKNFKSRNIKGDKGFDYATGGSQEIKELTVSLPLTMQRIVKASRKNDIYKEIYKAAKDAKKSNDSKLSEFIEIYEVGKGTKEDLLDQLKKFKSEDMEDVFNNLDTHTIQSPVAGNFIVARIKGEAKLVRIKDKKLWEGLNKLNRAEITDEQKVLNVVNKVFTKPFKNLITVYNPFFAVRNVMRDVPTAYIYGSIDNPVKYAKELTKSVIHVMTNNKQLQQFRALSGDMAGIASVEKSLKTPQKFERTLKATEKLLSLLNKLGDISETVPRFTEFREVLKKTGDLDEALWKSGEVTVNFARHGNVAKSIDTVTPYSNASIQGLDRFVRLVHEAVKTKNPAPLLKATGVVTIPTIALTLINKKIDPEGYANLPNHQRDNYFNIPLGDGKFIKIPKTREAGQIMGSFFDRSLDYALTGNKYAFKDFHETLQSSFGPINPLESHILRGYQDIRANKDWANRDIVPLYMLLDKRSKKNQYDDRTTDLAKAMGSKLNVSPMVIDHLMKSYLGVIHQSLGMSDVAKEKIGLGSVQSKKDNRGLLDKTGFAVDTKYVSEQSNRYYEMRDKVQEVKTDFAQDNDIKKIKEKYRGYGFSKEVQLQLLLSELPEKKQKEYLEIEEASKTINQYNQKIIEAREKEDIDEVQSIVKKANKKLYDEYHNKQWFEKSLEFITKMRKNK
jgi:hypothetical protein